MGGPISGIRYIHKAIRTELDALEEVAGHLDGGGSQEAADFRRRLGFLRAVVKAHANGEEEVLYPAVDERAHPVSATYVIEHEIEQSLSQEIDDLLNRLAGGAAHDGHSALLSQLRRQTIALNVTLTGHIRKEEEHLVPLAEEHFTIEEQEEIVRRSLAHYPPEQMREVLPWMMRALSADEQEEYLRMMMQGTPPEALRQAAQWIAEGVSAGQWAEMVRRVPELALN